MYGTSHLFYFKKKKTLKTQFYKIESGFLKTHTSRKYGHNQQSYSEMLHIHRILSISLSKLERNYKTLTRTLENSKLAILTYFLNPILTKSMSK